MSVKYKEIKSSRLINWYKTPDPWLWCDGSINIYRGCEHSCVYCDGKSEFYRIPYFGTIIRVKKNADEKVRQELIKNGFKPKSISTLDQHLNPSNISNDSSKNKITTVIAIGGGVCDVYQPAEKKFKMTRRVLNVIKEFEIPIIILTKSSYILQDLKLLKELNRRTYVNICFSVTLIDENAQKIFEPHSSSTTDRFKVLKQFREEGIHGGIMFMPILPGIADTEENIEKIITRTKEAKGEFIIAGGLTLKPGQNKQEYNEIIRKHYPHLIDLYDRYYRNNNRYGTPIESNYQQIMKQINSLCKKNNLPDRMPRYLPNEQRRENFILSTLINNLAYYRQYLEKNQFSLVINLQKIEGQIEQLPFNITEKNPNEIIALLNAKGRKIHQLITKFLIEGELAEAGKYVLPSWPIYYEN